MKAWAILTLLSCKACLGCVEPSLPGDDNDNNNDTAGQDSGDTAPDTYIAPPPCDWPEVEPNDSATTAGELPLDDWACGHFDNGTDADVLRVLVDDPGWLKVWVRAATLGSSADVQLTLQDSTGEYSAGADRSIDGPDPKLLVPVPGGRTWLLTQREAGGAHGEDYSWESTVTWVKQPVEWDIDEIEPNAGFDDGQIIEPGQRVFGMVSGANDNDWFQVVVPEGKSVLRAKVEAWNLGSPLDSKVSIYDPCQKRKITNLDEADVAGRDPVAEVTTSHDGTWGVLVRYDDQAGLGAGDLHWYVLTVQLETTPLGEDTGDTGAEEDCEEEEAAAAR